MGFFRGFLAGALMWAFLSFSSYLFGSSFWEFSARVASLWLGKDAMRLDLSSLALGVATHLGISSFLGFFYESFLKTYLKAFRSLGSRIVLGMFYGAGIWGISTYLVLPPLAPYFIDFVMAHDSLEGIWFFCHMLFGFALGVEGVFDSFRKNAKKIPRRVFFRYG